MPAELARVDAITSQPDPKVKAELMSRLIVKDDLAKLSEADRTAYYGAVCNACGLEPITQPFKYVSLQGKLVLYATKGASEQLRALHRISVTITGRERIDDVMIVNARGAMPDGRCDEAIGAVSLAGLRGEALANALMKAECVPLRSEILTRGGWKHYQQLVIGEEVAAYDCESDNLRWTRLLAVSTFPATEVVTFGTPLHNFQCTPNHSWAIERDKYKQRGESKRGPYANRATPRALIQADSIKAGHRVILAARCPTGGDSPLTPTDAGILGWVMTDGTIQRQGKFVRLGICQSKPDNLAGIRQLLTRSGLTFREDIGKPTVREFPAGNVYECLPQHWFYLNAESSRALLAKAGCESPAELPSVVTRLSPEARESMLNAMMLADADGRGRFGKKRKPGVMDAWQILCTLEGKALGKYESERVIPTQLGRKLRHMAGSNIRLTNPQLEAVWCPTTDFGTWVMRQDGNVTITGNTKAKRRVTLSLCGLGMLDETEVETIPSARVPPPPPPAPPAPPLAARQTQPMDAEIEAEAEAEAEALAERQAIQAECEDEPVTVTVLLDLLHECKMSWDELLEKPDLRARLGEVVGREIPPVMHVSRLTQTERNALAKTLRERLARRQEDLVRHNAKKTGKGAK